MAKGNIQVYIKKQLQKGISTGRIKVALSQAGYPKSEITEAFNQLIPKKEKRALSPFVIGLVSIIIVIGIIVSVILITPPKKIVPTLSEDELIVKIVEARSRIIEYYSNNYDDTFRNLFACLDRCDQYRNPSLQRDCEMDKTQYKFTKGIHEGQCPSGLVPIIEGLPIDMNKVCQGIVSKNCAIGGLDGDICQAFLDPNHCDVLEQNNVFDPGKHQSAAFCKRVVSITNINLKAMDANDPNVCNGLGKDIEFNKKLTCQILAEDNCQESFDQYSSDLAILELKKVNKLDQLFNIEGPGLCERVFYPELWKFCNDDSKDWGDLDEFRFGVYHTSR